MTRASLILCGIGLERLCITLFALLLAGGSNVALATSVGPTVKLAAGSIRAADRDAQGVLEFKGIPYAAPPVGPLRWRPPRPALNWKGIRDATVFGMRCWAPPLQGPAQLGGPASEDCLTLNIWTAAHSSDQKLPVMVWVHGGGFQFGASSEPNTDGTRLAQKGVVLVSFNYRLGIYGFLAHPALDQERPASGDFGLQDQIAALKWVRANIARFGGDPQNITLFGESAGAMSVGLLMTSPLASGLFQKAIAQSGAFWDSEHGSIKTHAEATARGRALADRVGHGSIEELRAIPTEVLGNQTAWNLKQDPVTDAFSPSIDGYVLHDSPARVFAQGRQADVPLLAGWNGAEAMIFMNRSLPHMSAAGFRSAAAAFFGQDRLADFSSVYPADTDATATSSAEALNGDLIIADQVWSCLQTDRRTGKASVFAYQFDYRSPYSPAPFHSADINFVFGMLTPVKMLHGGEPEPRDRELANQMMSYWVNFARTGNPNGPDLPAWPAYQNENPQVMLFDTVTQAAPESGTARFRFLESFRRDGRLPEGWREAR
jgi:para-nitrobenzyl esterase